MKIVLTGGGSGGHFYPLIAVAEELKLLGEQKNILQMELHYFAHTPYDEKALFDNQIKFSRVPAGKIRRYFSLENITDIFKTFFGFFVALYKLFVLYPDVVFSKGGFPAVPVVLAARVLRIPIIIHESDTIPGRATKLTAKYADRVAISFKEAFQYFDPKKVALVGHLVRRELQKPIKEGAYEYLKLNPTIPTIFIMGGSQGAKIINETVLSTLPSLVEKYQIIHQTGVKNFEEIKIQAEVILEKKEDIEERYHPFPYLNPLALRMCAGVANLVISRAGASSIAEIAWWGTPSIVIPITDSNGDHQRKNAFSYSATGAGVVIEEKNLTPQIFLQEIQRIIDDEKLQSNMKKATELSRYENATKTIASELISIGFKHEN